MHISMNTIMENKDENKGYTKINENINKTADEKYGNYLLATETAFYYQVHSDANLWMAEVCTGSPDMALPAAAD